MQASKLVARHSPYLAFLAAFLQAFVHLHREQKATGINRSRLREQSPIDYYFFLEAAFLAAGFLAQALEHLQADLQNFT